MDNGIFPQSFWPLALAHALALLSPGPDFMLIVSHAVRYGWRGSAFICLGIVAGNAAYIGLAIVGWAEFGGGPTLYKTLETAGAFFLFWMGTRLVKAAKHPLPPMTEDVARLSVPSQMIIGLGSAVLNPKNMIFYLTIMTVLIESEASISQRLAAGIWMCAAVMAWDVFLAVAVSRPNVRERLWRHLPKIELLCGIVLLLLAVSLLIMPWL